MKDKLTKMQINENYTFFLVKMGHCGRLGNSLPLHRLVLQVGTENVSTYYVGMVGKQDDG